jgi:outer membrane protein OmpA-like peptidoglycan-associated protein
MIIRALLVICVVTGTATAGPPSGYQCKPGTTKVGVGCACPAGYVDKRDGEDIAVCAIAPRPNEPPPAPEPELTLLEIRGVRGADVSVDGKSVGQTPIIVSVTAGKHQLGVTKAGYAKFSESVTLASAESRKVTARLTPIKAAKPNDKDGDGIVDANDKCADQMETPNGFADDDGCPDEVPEKVARFVGALQGVNFKVGSAQLLMTSNKYLDALVALLKEFNDLKIEIQGHVDDLTRDQALSQSRAETILAYLVTKGIDFDRLIAKGYGDTQPLMDPSRLKGGLLNIARSRNRRIEIELR